MLALSPRGRWWTDLLTVFALALALFWSAPRLSNLSQPRSRHVAR